MMTITNPSKFAGKISDKQRLDWLGKQTGYTWHCDVKYEGTITFNDESRQFPGDIRKAIDRAIAIEERCFRRFRREKEKKDKQRMP